MQVSESAPPQTSSRSAGRVVVKNTIYLTVAQALTVPISVLMNAVTARFLGAADFGHLYLAGTLCAFGILAVEWGAQGALPAMIARANDRAGAFLGTSLVWRACAAVLVYGVLVLIARLLSYGSEVQWALGLSFALATVNSFAAACKDGIRGFERADIPAKAHVGQQLMAVAVVVPVLFLGGRVRALLVAQILVAALTVLLLVRTLRRVGIGGLSFERGGLKPLLAAGTPFVFFELAMVLQPNVDAMYLSKLAPPEVMGWYAVSRRLIGLLIFPASALIGALYPTLCRLYSDDRQSFMDVSRHALYGVAMLVVPAALGCALFPELGIAVFGQESFGNGANNLRILAAFLALVYFSMPLGTCILAANKQVTWSFVQSLCIVVSLVLDPFLIRWFQASTGNGGLGLCVAAVISELVVVSCGVFLAPRGLFDRRLARSIALAFLAGAAMAGVAWLLRAASPFLAAPLAVTAYVLVLWVTGGIEPLLLQAVKAFFARKFGRAGAST